MISQPLSYVSEIMILFQSCFLRQLLVSWSNLSFAIRSIWKVGYAKDCSWWWGWRTEYWCRLDIILHVREGTAERRLLSLRPWECWSLMEMLWFSITMLQVCNKVRRQSEVKGLLYLPRQRHSTETDYAVFLLVTYYTFSFYNEVYSDDVIKTVPYRIR